MMEARWYKSGYRPSLAEYLENAWISIAGPAILIHSVCILSDDQISLQTNLNALSNQETLSIIRSSSTLFRLTNDLATQSAEMARGDVPKSIQCYMWDKGASDDEAREHVKQLISDTWERLNKRTSSLPPRFVEIAMNLGRMSHCVYYHGDGYGRPDEAKIVHRLLSLLVHPVHIPPLP